jgi:hypothetical protein
MCVCGCVCFTGTMISLSLMAVPVFLDTTDQAPQLFKEWLSMYNYGFPTLPTISIVTCALYLFTALRARALGSPCWALSAAAGVVTVVMVPFTWVYMWPTNEAIMALEKETRGLEGESESDGKGKRKAAVADIGEARILVRKWNRTHFTRSLFPLAGALVGLYGLLQMA